MRRFTLRWLKRIFRASVYGVVGAVIVLIAVFVVYLESRPELQVWHEAELDEEFEASSGVHDFPGYLELEDRLFRQLRDQVIEPLKTLGKQRLNRYSEGSLSDPGRWPTDWNRSFELPRDRPRIGVLLLHGMSDSPYSLRALGTELHRAGAWVVGLRLPGHGTAPSGLVEVHWKDMAAAVRLAMAHLRKEAGAVPLYILGYSNGGALAVHYALTALDDGDLARPSGLMLVSPAIGVTSLAALAVWQARLGHLFGLDMLAWNAILPEYDPFKYGSFAVNAGDQVYRLTEEIRSGLALAERAGKLDLFPPVLAFQSIVDATVSPGAVVDGLFRRLPRRENELVLFDINRNAEIEWLLAQDPGPAIRSLLEDPALGFTLTLVSNENEDSLRMVLIRNLPTGGIELGELDVTWPEHVYSLSHVALPFPPDDPLYGIARSDQRRTLTLGELGLRGERGVLQIPAADMLRQRWNPFYRLMRERVLAFTGLAPVERRRLPLEAPVSN